MGAPYEFVNVTKRQYYQYHSGRVYHDGITNLLFLFKSGVWDLSDEIVHEQNLLDETDDDEALYYKGKAFTSVDTNTLPDPE